MAGSRISVRTWRRMTILGGVLLTGLFFAPTVDCSGGIVPADKVNETLRTTSLSHLSGASASGWIHFAARRASMFFLFCAPYVFGAVVALAAAARIGELHTVNRHLGRMLFVFELVIAAGVFGLAVLEHESYKYVQYSFGWPNIFPCLIVPALGVAYAWRALRFGKQTPLYHAWIATVVLVLWAARWILEPIVSDAWYTASYGAYLTLVAAVLLAVSLCGELAAETRHSWKAALGMLMTCTLRQPRVNEPHCTDCGYRLTGLDQPRCPECGTPFPDELLSAARPNDSPDA